MLYLSSRLNALERFCISDGGSEGVCVHVCSKRRIIHKCPSSFVWEKEKRKKVGNRKISVDGKLHEGNLSAK